MAKRRSRPRVGELPPRYGFLLNPYSDLRCSRCPKCDRLTHPRKFALLIHIDGWGPLVLGKTCRYCTPCELIIAHQDELEAELVGTFERLDPDVIGNDYLVIGTMDRRFWKESLQEGGHRLDDSLKHISEFKNVLTLKAEAGWGPA